MPDLDLYVRRKLPPDLADFTCRPLLTGSDEVCKMRDPKPGTWHLAVQNYLAPDGTPYGITAKYR